MMSVLAHGGVIGATLEIGLPIMGGIAIFWFTRKSRKGATKDDSGGGWGAGGRS